MRVSERRSLGRGLLRSSIVRFRSETSISLGSVESFVVLLMVDLDGCIELLVPMEKDDTCAVRCKTIRRIFLYMVLSYR